MAPGRMFRKWDFRRDKTKKNEQARYIAPSATQALSGLSPFNSLPVSSAKGNSITLYAGNFFRVAVWVLQDYLNFMEISKWKNEINVVKSNQFTSKHQLPYYGRFDADSIREQLHQQAEKIYPEVDCPFRKTIKASIDRLFQSSSIAETVAVLNETLEFYVTAKNPYLQNWFEIKDDSSPTGGADSLFRLTVDPESDSITVSWCKVFGDNFLFAVSQILQIIRDAERNWTFVEFLAFHVAYFKLSQGATVEGSTRARFIGTPGFRTYTQTYMSLTDPGDGHVNGTTRKNKWMNGAIVHVEHLERPNNLPRTMIESYRIPSILDFAKVRLHVGPAAPTTYFVGRALKDGGEFEHDLIKVINTVSAAATAAFALGSAECKVAMCNLTTSDMVTYMRGLAGHVLRNAGRQYLSCAWNLNTEIVDDLPPHSRKQPKILKNRMEIGRRAIEVAALGGFDKVTWDGASDTYPSRCIIEQLGFQNALELVHLAHSAGFVTYFSAGFKFNNIADAVLSGVDGIGIGGAQVLRYMDHQTGMHGPYIEENIDEIDARRDEAAASIRGRGVKLLCRLDRMNYEGSITEEEEQQRAELYDALYNIDEARIEKMLQLAQRIVDMPDDGEKPFLGNARRLVQSPNPILKKHAKSEGEWNKSIAQIKIAVSWEDEDDLYDRYYSAPWLTWRMAHKNSEVQRKDFYFHAKISPGSTAVSPVAI